MHEIQGIKVPLFVWGWNTLSSLVPLRDEFHEYAPKVFSRFILPLARLWSILGHTLGTDGKSLFSERTCHRAHNRGQKRGGKERKKSWKKWEKEKNLNGRKRNAGWKSEIGPLSMWWKVCHGTFNSRPALVGSKLKLQWVEVIFEAHDNHVHVE